MCKRLCAAVLAACLLLGMTACGGQKQTAAEATDWNQTVLRTMLEFEDGGGYDTGMAEELFDKSAWQGLEDAFQLSPDAGWPVIDVAQARPSFCSAAAYMLLLKSLLNWDGAQAQRTITHDAWANLKPYTVPVTMGSTTQQPQADGAGCWGRVNADGPGLAVLVSELGAGQNTYLGHRDEYADEAGYLAAWDALQPGDFLKIYENAYIGENTEDRTLSEFGKTVLFLRRVEATAADGTRDDVVYYWTSNGDTADAHLGYSIGRARLSEIYRAVGTHITDPAQFEKARTIETDNIHEWLAALASQNGSVEELKAACGIA